MTRFYETYISTTQAIAARKKLRWPPDFDASGQIVKFQRWDLNALVGIVKPQVHYVSTFNVEELCEEYNTLLDELRLPRVSRKVMSAEWRDFYLATTIYQLFVERNKPPHTHMVGRYVRLLAAVAGDTPPWQLDADLVRKAYNVVLKRGQSGKNAKNFKMVVSTMFDDRHLTEFPTLAIFCTAIRRDDQAQQVQRERGIRDRQRSHEDAKQILERLSDRQHGEKLPGDDEFWEYIRIIFQEHPRGFSDAIRFEAFIMEVVTGFRIGENVGLPVDCLKTHRFYDSENRPADLSGGIGSELVLRHFAEKQEHESTDGQFILYENIQTVPRMFEDLVTSSVEKVRRLTKTMRDRLRRQTDTGRIFPEFLEDSLAPAIEMCVRCSGNAVFSTMGPPSDLIERYKKTFDPVLLDEMYSYQLTHATAFQPVAKYWQPHRKRGLIFRQADGAAISGTCDWASAFVNVGELEAYIRKHLPTKLPDTQPSLLPRGRKFFPHDQLFLMPIRNMIEGRHGGIMDVERYAFIGTLHEADLSDIVTGNSDETIFQRYGKTPEAKAYRTRLHFLRHMQSTVLLSKGVQDSIVGRRFNREARQNEIYDHRTLAEIVGSVTISARAKEYLGPNAREVYRLIKAGVVAGPLVTEFRRIQQEHGDVAAFEYLNAEGDGLHVTPYGFCSSSFTIDPCPKHLECYNGCRHLMRTEVEQETENLKKMETMHVVIVDTIEALPEGRRGPGWKNQLRHTKTLLSNIRVAISSNPGEHPFPSGPDLSDPIGRPKNRTVLD